MCTPFEYICINVIGITALLLCLLTFQTPCMYTIIKYTFRNDNRLKKQTNKANAVFQRTVLVDCFVCGVNDDLLP